MTDSVTKMKPSARRKARRFAVQAVYQWQLSGNEPADIKIQFLEENDFKKTDVDYFAELLISIPENIEQLDELLKPHLDRKITDVDPVERAVLRIATYELKYRLDVPYRVVINEAVELSKVFGATDGYKFVNGVVDKLAADIRSSEVIQHTSKRAKG